MTIGVSFDQQHCLDDLGMYLTDAEIGLPEVRTGYLDAPGRDGLIDLTTALTGSVQYRNRTITLTFQTTPRLCGRASWQAWLSEVSGALHGQVRQIKFDGDSGYYSGRCAVESFVREGELMTLTVVCDCSPYKVSSTDGSKSL